MKRKKMYKMHQLLVKKQTRNGFLALKDVVALQDGETVIPDEYIITDFVKQIGLDAQKIWDDLRATPTINVGTVESNEEDTNV